MTPRAVLGVLLAALVLTGCSGGTETGTSAGDGRGDGSSLRWERCDLGRDIECATLEVPLDWSNPAGEKIELALGRRRASGRRLGTLVLNPGGPGGSGLELLTYDPSTRAIAARFDRVSWDPRGVGRSTPLRCGSKVADLIPLDPDPDDAAERSTLEDAARAVSEECAALDGPLLAHMRTSDTARDLEAIRAALGSAGLNYLGYSYGTYIGQVYAALFPEKVAKMVLDGVVDPSESFTDFLLGQTAAFDAALDLQARDCERAGEAACGVDDLLAAYDRVRADVEITPLRTPGGAVGPAELAIAGITSAYEPQGWRTLGPALADALQGDGSALKAIADSYHDMASYPPYAAVECSDGPTPVGFEEYRAFETRALEISPRFGGAVANELLPCATWPVRNTELPPATIGAIPPILLIANRNDPATPFANAERVNARIQGSVLVAVDSDGHTAFGSNACVNRIVEKYLVRSELPHRSPTEC